MSIKHLLSETIPEISNMLEKSIKEDYHVTVGEELGRSGREGVYDILDTLLSVLFPGCFSEDNITLENINQHISEQLRYVSYRFIKHLKDSFNFMCDDKKCQDCDCEQRAGKALSDLIKALPEVRKALITDIRAAKDGDPAATSLDEIVLSYPYIEAIATHRIAHELYKSGVPIIPRIMSERAHSKTGIDIHPGAKIGESFFIDHGTGVVIGETTTIGKKVKLYQGVTLGALSPFDKEGKPRVGEKRHPDIEDDVIIYANATILGGKTVIGKGSIIGGNTWVTTSVPPGSVIYKN
ncbi:MAG: serine acetyltransferase [Spirochaetaceae bacterium]|nr:serine acetyltransferase [Spirochaetaceae bacterium]